MTTDGETGRDRQGEGLGESSLASVLDAFAAPAPSPAGGSAAALAAASAAGLVAMVGRGSPGWEGGRETAERADALRRELLALAEDDVTAIAGLLAAFRGSTGSSGERDAALRSALEVPAAIARCAAEVASLAAAGASAGKRVMAADAAVAAALAATAARAAALVVEVNADALRRVPEAAVETASLGSTRAAADAAATAAEGAVAAVRPRPADLTGLPLAAPEESA